MRRFALLLLLISTTALAQEPPPVWSTSLGAGLAMTSGNRDTQNLNFSFSTEYDPKTVHVFKAEALYIRAEADEELTADKAAAFVRYERTIRERAFAFAETSYLRDPFKELDYSVSPVIGAGYHLIQSEAVQLTLDGAAGVTIERDSFRGRRQYEALKGGQAFEWNISEATKLTEKLTALWKASDLGDALYQVESAVATTIVRSLELKVSGRYDHKTRPPLATLKKGDSALFAALVYKISR